MKRSLLARPLFGKDVDGHQVEQVIENLLDGSAISIIPTDLVNPVSTVLRARRKDAILHRKENLAAKIEVILGEIEHGPHPLLPDTTVPLTRSRTLDTFKDSPLQQTTRSVMTSKKIDSIDSLTRQSITPMMKLNRQSTRSREEYQPSTDYDITIDKCVEYANDSKRIGPRLLKMQKIEQRLNASKDELEEAKQKAIHSKKQFDLLEKDNKQKLESKLKTELLDYGSHIPTTLPLEFSKFSNKVLDTRFRQFKSTGVRFYEEADSLGKEALKREHEEMDANNERFIRSFKLNQEHLSKKQREKREIFAEQWRMKRAKMLFDSNTQYLKAKSAVEHQELQLKEATQHADAEFTRIQGGVKGKSLTPVPARAKSSAIPKA